MHSFMVHTFVEHFSIIIPLTGEWWWWWWWLENEINFLVLVFFVFCFFVFHFNHPPVFCLFVCFFVPLVFFLFFFLIIKFQLFFHWYFPIISYTHMIWSSHMVNLFFHFFFFILHFESIQMKVTLTIIWQRLLMMMRNNNINNNNLFVVATPTTTTIIIITTREKERERARVFLDWLSTGTHTHRMQKCWKKGLKCDVHSIRPTDRPMLMKQK